MGTESEKQYRAEIRSKDNEVKGVYSWVDALGNAHTVAYNADSKNGYRTLPIDRAGLQLPNYPYGLYHPKKTQPLTVS